MDATRVIERVERVAATRLLVAAGAADTSDLGAALGDVREVRAWLDRSEALIVAALTPAVSFPESAIAEHTRESLGAATKTIERSNTLDEATRLADALEEAAITAGHVDALTRATKGLADHQRDALIDAVDALTDIATHATVEQFQRRIALEKKRVLADDGLDRLERQQQATSLRTWVDDEGMWNLRGRFDPVTGVRLAAAINSAVETLFAETVPEHCPTDRLAKQDFLRAHAAARLIDGKARTGRPRGRPEFVVVIDADTPAGSGVSADWNIPVEIPTQVLADLAADADIHTVVVRNGVVLHAPGQLDAGRTTRLANQAQRRALRALYRTCAIPGCAVHYDRCKLHHIIWWEHAGPTDLANLLPLCSHHHTQVHHHDWKITLGPHRELSVDYPDGTRRSTRPPRRSAAA
jgi:hypothetical protein